MKLKDLLKQQVNKVEKHTIKLTKKDKCDVYVRVMSCGEVEDLPDENAARTQVAITILDENHDPIFTVDEARDIPYDVYIQLVEVSNKVNGVVKVKP